MSQPPKSTILAPSARWLSLRTVLRVTAGSLMQGWPDYPRSPRRGPARGSVMVMGVAAVAGVRRAPAVAAEAVIRAFDLQGGVADVEALAQHGRGRVSQCARIDTVLDHQVGSHRGPGGCQ